MLCRIGLHNVIWYADHSGSWFYCTRCNRKEDQWVGSWPLILRLKWRLLATIEAWR